MMLYGLIELLIKIQWAWFLIKWFMGRHVIYLELEHKAYWVVRQLNSDPILAGKTRLLKLSSLEEWRNEAYENACLFKEKVKKWHDKRILKIEFNVGDKVLLYRSRLKFFAGKLISKWEGPFIIEEVYRSGAIKINSLDGDKPQVVNGQ